MKLDNYECEGQLSFFEIADKPQKFHEAEWLRGHGFKNIYDERPPAGVCEFADIECPTKTKKLEVTENGNIVLGSLAMGTFSPKWWRPVEPDPVEEIKDDYIRENPTCFYVTGHYLDREQGWHKVPDELPNFTTWQLVDVVLYGKQTGTPWMEHGKWEAKDWSFRSVDDRRNTETTDILAWKLSNEVTDGD